MGIDESLITKAIEVFQPMAERTLSRDDGREIVQNLTTFFEILARVDAKRDGREIATPARTSIASQSWRSASPARSVVRPRRRRFT